MPDIAMCSPEKIYTICKKCYRRTAIPTPYWQSYSRFAPDIDEKCEHYMKEK